MSSEMNASLMRKLISTTTSTLGDTMATLNPSWRATRIPSYIISVLPAPVTAYNNNG